MNEKKNIDRLFQEKFKDFEMAPPEMAWHNIETELLKDKKKRRVIPLWYRLGGIAALLIIGLLVSMPFINGNSDESSNVNSVVVDGDNGAQGSEGRIYPTKDPVQSNEIVVDSADAFRTNTGSGVASGSGDTPAGNNSDLESGTTNNNRQRSTGEVKEQEDAVASGTGSQINRNRTKNNKEVKTARGFNNTLPSNDGIAHKNKNNNTHKNRKNTTIHNSPQYSNSSVAQRENNGGNGSGKNTDTQKLQNTPNTVLPSAENANRTIAASQKGNDGNGTVVNNSSNVIDTGKQVIDIDKANEAVAMVPPVNDSIAQQPENPLEKLLKEKELGKEKDDDKAVAENNAKWNIKPQMAPVFYNSLGDGSPIDPGLANNSKTYDNDLSYGVGVNYALSNKISIRSGINTVNLSYSTNNIQFYAALNGQTSNVTGRGTRANIVVQNQGVATSGSGGNGFSPEGLDGQKFNGSMVQKMGYLEVPLEMSYKLLDKRFGIHVIGGVSTLFLNDNNVSVVSNQGLSTDVGEAENLNNIHFSTNLGVGFRYRFWKAFEANFEPMFKYQLNTFSSDSGNFKPYFIGLYSGISFSF